MEAGRLVAAGRDGAVYEFGPGRVLRKTFDGRSIASEARIMQYVAEHGFPVPRIDEVRAGGTEIVMERIDGPMMMHHIENQPWTMRAQARVLADLADRLHEIRAPEWLRRFDDDGDRVLHLDLHPMNVMITERGPVVIDWSNAACGEPLSDVALTYVLLVGPQMPAPWIVRTVVQPVRNVMGRAFAHRYRGAPLEACIARMAALKTFDKHMLPTEIERLERMARRRAPG